jgi:hypothetical protein
VVIVVEKQIGYGDVERLGKPEDILQSNISLAPLDTADVGSVDASLFGKLLLAQTYSLTEGSDSFAEADKPWI